MGYVDVDALRNMWTFMFGVMFFLIVVIVGLVIWIVRLKKKIRAQEETIKTFTEITTMHNEFYEKVSTILP